MIEMLKDKYRFLRRIGAGGMAQIHLAEDLSNGKMVAIKIISPDKINDYSARKRFKSEIELTKKVDSPYVVKVYDSVWTDEIQYIALEHIEGHILKDYINKNTRLGVDEVVEFSKQLALGFDEIHRVGIIHRDIKSQNIMIGPYGSIKIIDFGIALSDSSERLTQTGNLIASPQYIAPELVKQTSKPNVQTDIYALGVLIYEMLAGNVPFRESSPVDTAFKHTTSNIPRISKTFPNVPNSLSNIIAKATFKDLKFRYKTMYEMFKDLDVCLLRDNINEPDFNPYNKSEKSIKSFVNSKWFLIGLIAGIIVILLAIIITMLVVFVL